jgi:hypothetical protein
LDNFEPRVTPSDPPSLPGVLPAVQPRVRLFRRVSKIILIILTILWAVLLIPAVMFALLSPFAFDSGATPAAFQVFYMLISFPFVLLIAPVIAWILYWLKLHTLAVIVACIPAMWFVFAVFVMD